MIKLYLGYYLEALTDNQLEVLDKLKFETYERENILRFRKEVKNKKEIVEVLKTLKTFEIVPGYALQKDEDFYDFDEETSKKNEIIIDELGEGFLLFLLSILEKEKEAIQKDRETLKGIIESLSYDYMVQINIWNRYGYARLYIKQEDEDIGFLDLIHKWYKSEPEYEKFFKDLMKDKRILNLSQYFLKKEGYIK
ncbi:hypothetical protein X925_04270 [Petrotoga sp. 9T1HF07.CasAA.8.2]|uniref:hypothetical protein n=1 Tax=Petrotoga sp. 9T1HF07.CasAA.8.2 TaxID=1434329 RepID=UPI000CBE228B|nr:hypothetical protein [Petrotoga sp. 9T1HF07.CasAA.8.2]PNR89087.1 hypothetical protein X925_04270 [Petrotoga sp. 9T1HF07.CasAA.8.2]